jgi:D-alanyl-lipoteichoic acid acyltransferase DltB (MBOAT superfamily)
VLNLGILGCFKYFNFFADSFSVILNTIGFKVDPFILNIALPVGISFYTFHGMSYIIDIYRKNTVPTKKFIDYSVFVCFFPLLVAGPIERATHLLPQILKPRNINFKQIGEGLVLILIGLFRKVVIADNISAYVGNAFAFSDSYPSMGLVVGVLIFAVQIYCDFAGYSDIARGTAKMMGFELLINFKQPYFSASITEFWRRWHISLSSWLRDYLYISLGGNRKGKFNTYRNLFITMLLGGIWHGASWMFVIWGALNGFYLAVHKWWLDRKNVRIKEAVTAKATFQFFIAVVFTNILVCFTWIFFRAGSVDEAFSVIGGILSMRGSFLDVANPGKVLEPGLYLLISVICILIIDIPMYKSDSDVVFTKKHWSVQVLLYSAIIISLMLLGGDNEAQFIYFQF